MHALAAVIAIKFKIIVIGIFIFGAIFYGVRIWAGKGIGCPEPSIVKEPFYPWVLLWVSESLLNIFNYYSHRHGITAYAHTSPDIYSSYPGLAYPGHSSGIVYSNPHTGSDSLYSQPPPGADVYSPIGYSASTADVPDEVLAGSHYKRKGRSVDDDQPRQSSSSTSTQIDFAEIMFTFLNVNTMDCKRRFVCEVDFLSKRDPWIRMGYNMLG